MGDRMLSVLPAEPFFFLAWPFLPSAHLDFSYFWWVGHAEKRNCNRYYAQKKTDCLYRKKYIWLGALTNTNSDLVVRERPKRELGLPWTVLLFVPRLVSLMFSPVLMEDRVERIIHAMCFLQATTDNVKYTTYLCMGAAPIRKPRRYFMKVVVRGLTWITDLQICGRVLITGSSAFVRIVLLNIISTTTKSGNVPAHLGEISPWQFELPRLHLLLDTPKTSGYMDQMKYQYQWERQHNCASLRLGQLRASSLYVTLSSS